MMRRLLLIVSVLAAFAIQAANTRTWDEGALRWSDFAGEPVVVTTPTFFKGVLQVKTVQEPADNLRPSAVARLTATARAVMLKDMSYAIDSCATPQMLRYHQLQFDLLELMRRRLQAELNAGVEGLEADTRLKHYQRLYDEKIADLARRTVNGSNDNRLQEEEYYVRKSLEEFYLPQVAELKYGNFSYGWFIGTGTLIPTGEIADIFKSSWLFNIGLTAGYKRFMLKADISYGQPDLVDVRREIYVNPNRPVDPSRREWAVNKYLNQLSGGISLGYRVVDTKKFSITPHVGGGWTNYAWDVADYVKNPDNPDNNPEIEYKIDSEIRRNKIHNFNVMAGIDFDWHFHSVVSDNPSFISGHREQYTSSLRLSPYIINQRYTSLVDKPSGIQIGITLTYTGIARSIGLK